MPRSARATLEKELYDKDENLILVEASFKCYPRKKARMNWGGLPDPPEPPRAELEDFKVLEVVEGDIAVGDVDDEALFEQHADYLIDEALESAGR